jgi:hypothetical protein
MTLADLLPDADYRFRLGLDRGSIAQFFSPTPAAARVPLLAERSRWLQSHPARHAALLSEGIPLLDEAIALASELSLSSGPERFTVAPDAAPLDRCVALGRWWEPDFLLLKADAAGVLRLCGGCVCFPSSWSLEEKVGRPLDWIHAAVPGLNQQIGRRIQVFLTGMKPGVAWERSNWGLSRSRELNQHPARALPRLEGHEGTEEVWFRVEHQALVALPRTASILFGIRISVHPLTAFASEPVARERLCRALRTMPDAVAEYKGLLQARARVLQILES